MGGKGNAKAGKARFSAENRAFGFRASVILWPTRRNGHQREIRGIFGVLQQTTQRSRQPPEGTADVKIVKSTTRKFRAHMRLLSESMARKTADAWCAPIEVARESTRGILRDLIPEGQSTPGHYFYTLFEGPTRVG